MKNLELANLKLEKNEIESEFRKQEELKSWLEKKDMEIMKLIETSVYGKEINTINSMKFQLSQKKSNVHSDYLENYKNAIRIYQTLKPGTFIVNVT